MGPGVQHLGASGSGDLLGDSEDTVRVLREVDGTLQTVSPRGHDAARTFSSVSPPVLKLHLFLPTLALSGFLGVQVNHFL